MEVFLFGQEFINDSSSCDLSFNCRKKMNYVEY